MDRDFHFRNPSSLIRNWVHVRYRNLEITVSTHLPYYEFNIGLLIKRLTFDMRMLTQSQTYIHPPLCLHTDAYGSARGNYRNPLLWVAASTIVVPDTRKTKFPLDTRKSCWLHCRWSRDTSYEGTHERGNHAGGSGVQSRTTRVAYPLPRSRGMAPIIRRSADMFGLGTAPRQNPSRRASRPNRGAVSKRTAFAMVRKMHPKC